MKNILVLPFGLYLSAKEAARKQGITIVELCQRACVCKVDEVRYTKPLEHHERFKTQEDHGLEA